MKELFLDANAHLPLSKGALEAFSNFNSSRAGHGHAMSPSAPGRAAMTAIEEARETIAELLGAESSSQIMFTSTCTQACEWAVRCLAKTGVHTHVLTSKAEHPAVRDAVNDNYHEGGIINMKIRNGIVEIPEHNDLESFACLYVQNELGTIQPIEKITSRMYSDFSQAPGKIRFNLKDFDKLEFSTFAAHKFGGPSSVGILYVKNHDDWYPLGTGSRYYFDRPGTPDAGSIVATAFALKETMERFDSINENMLSFRTTLENGLEELGVEIIAKNSNRVNNTTFIKLKTGYGMKIMMELGNDMIYTGLGSACGSSYSGANPFLKAMGVEGGPHDFMRISTFGEYSSKDACYFLDKFRKYYLKGGD